MSMPGSPSGIAPEEVRTAVSIGSLRLENPVLTASGTYGLGYEFASMVDLARIGGVVGKTVTTNERIGNPPPRTFETASGMLNSIGLMNPGWDGFVREVLPKVQALPCPFVLNVAGKSFDDFVELVRRAEELEGVAGLELNLSCPNVAGGLDFSATPEQAHRLVAACRAVTTLPLLAKLSPNVGALPPIAVACQEAGADGLSLINTFLGTAIDWKRRTTVFPRVIAGLSGPAIKPLALLAVMRTAAEVTIPIIGIGGIRQPTDVLEYLIAGATAVQVGTACFLDPELPVKLGDGVRALLAEQGIADVHEVIGAAHRRDPEERAVPAPAG